MSGSPPANPSTPVRITSGAAFRRRYRPYFTKRQLATLSNLKRSAAGISTKETTVRHASCKFIQQVCRKIGFPQTTTSTAQGLYHRFYLYYSIREYPPQEISITCIFVACKIEETFKNLRDILVAAHSVRHPQSAELDPEHVSEERKRKIMGYEKLVMESICFDYQQPHPYGYVVKFVKWIEAMQTPSLVDGKRLAQEAYKLAVNSYQIPLCIEYPAHTIAAGCIYLASMLIKSTDASFEGLAKEQPWDQFFCSRIEDIEDVCLQILDLYITSSTRQDRERYTEIKIKINEQATERGTDPNMDEVTKEELGARDIDWEFDQTTTPLEIVNTNQHTVCYEFSLTAS